MRWWCLAVPLFVWLASGCARPAAVLKSGDVVRPELSFAPKEPWPAGAKVAIGMLVQVERPGGDMRYLRDEEVAPEQAEMLARVTFLNGDLPLGEHIEVPLVRDC